MRSETKIFNEWYFKKYGGIISIGTMTGAILKSWVRKGFDAGWQHRQTEVDELQAEFYETENHLKEQIQQRDQKVKELTYLQEMDRDLIRALQGKSNELQKRVDAVKQLIQVYRDEEKELELKEWEQSTIYGRIAIELEQALKGGGE